MIFDGLFDRRPTMTPAELAEHLYEQYAELEADLIRRARKLVAQVEPDHDPGRLEAATFGLWAFAAYWGLASSPVEARLAQQISDELVLEWTRARSDDAEWQEANEQVVELFNALAENQHVDVSDGELPGGKEVYHGHLFLASVLGEEHEGRFDLHGALQVYQLLVQLAGTMESVGEKFRVRG